MKTPVPFARANRWLSMLCVAAATHFAVAQSSLPAPENFTADAAGTSIKLKWKVATAAGSYAVEVFDQKNMKVFFRGPVAQPSPLPADQMVKLTIGGACPGDAYFATVRSVSPQGLVSDVPTAAAAGRVVIEEVVLNEGCGTQTPACGYNCAEFPAALNNLVGTSLSWGEPNRLRRDVYNIKVRRGNKSSTFKLAREGMNTTVVRLSKCGAEVNCNCTKFDSNDDGKADQVRCESGGSVVCSISFDLPNDIDFVLAPNWSVQHKKETCLLPGFTNGLGGTGTGDGLLPPSKNPGGPAGELWLAAFPNPTSSGITFDFDMAGRAAGSLAIINLLGEQVAAMPTGETGSGLLEFDASGLPAGSYFAVLQTADGQVAARFEKF